MENEESYVLTPKGLIYAGIVKAASDNNCTQNEMLKCLYRTIGNYCHKHKLCIMPTKNGELEFAGFSE